MKILNTIVGLYSSTDETFDCGTKKIVPRWLLSLPGAGCEWAKKCGGRGCTMCALPDAAREFSHGHLLPTFVFSGLFNLARRSIREVSPEILAIYNAGSFLCDREIPRAFQLEVCRRVVNDPTLRILFVESRAEYVTPEKIGKMVALLNGKTLQVGIGLEVADEHVRNTVIKKGLTNASFERAVRVIKELGGQVLAYVFIKPVGFSEKEAIAEAVTTARYAFAVGVDIVAFEAALIHPKTEMARQYLAGGFRPPWLWTIITVLQQAYPLGYVYMGNFDWGDDRPYPLDIPRNCPKCSERIRQALHRFRRTNDIAVLDDAATTCGCKKEWERETR